jgi:hypothetical protein
VPQRCSGSSGILGARRSRTWYRDGVPRRVPFSGAGGTLEAPVFFCFNGKRAAKQYFATSSVEYRYQKERLGRTTFFVAPSTSGAASRYWDVEIWRDLAARVRRARGAA